MPPPELNIAELEAMARKRVEALIDPEPSMVAARIMVATAPASFLEVLRLVRAENKG